MAKPLDEQGLSRFGIEEHTDWNDLGSQYNLPPWHDA